MIQLRPPAAGRGNSFRRANHFSFVDRFRARARRLWSLAALVGLGGGTLLPAAGPAIGAGVTTQDLRGAWQVAESGSNDWFAATVPGCIHTDLLAAGRIPDPFYRDNERRVQWVGERNWTYRRAFVLSPALAGRPHLWLRCEGLDTLATLRLNGKTIGQTDNMFRTWEFDVRSAVQPGTNVIEVKFQSVLPFIRAKEAEKHLPTWTYPGTGWVRKMPCDFGWDWGPTLITCGIWRPISLVACDAGRLDDVQITQQHVATNLVNLRIAVTAAPVSQDGLTARVTVLAPDGPTPQTASFALTNRTGATELAIHAPQLWWPAGLGEHPLYTVQVALLDAHGTVLDTTEKRIGLRTLELVPQTDAAPLHFVVNGRPFFAKGASWIPADVFPTRLTRAQLRRYVADAAAANMNMLRFWGGGYYEDDALFDACDELGICVWLDFKFACTTYPAFDPAFLANVRQEAVDNVRRLRHHPSIAIWCGNNEIKYFRGKEWKWIPDPSRAKNEAEAGKMGEADYYRLFRDTLGGVVRQLAPDSSYVTGSPDCGDVHYWGVWHGGKPFSAYRDIHGFMSEFGFESFPAPATVAAFTAPADRTNVYSPIMKYHMRSNRMYLDAPEDGHTGTDKLMKIVRENFGEPKDFESALWLSQINQAYGIENAVLGWRREMPRSLGCLFWQYNDDWPGTSWSSVDYFGRWKALQYRARQFYAPVLVSGEFIATNQNVAIWLTNDRLTPARGPLRWRVTDLAGTQLDTGQKLVEQAPQTSSVVAWFNLHPLTQRLGATNLLVWLDFNSGDQPQPAELLLLAPPRQLALKNPELDFTVRGGGREFTVTVRARHPALWVWLDQPGTIARFSDNFISLTPGENAVFKVTLDQPMSSKTFRQTLRVRSLFDLGS